MTSPGVDSQDMIHLARVKVPAVYRYASVFQMLRGTMVVFTGILTVLLLKRRLHGHHWLGIVLISAGAAIVGASRWETLT